MKNKSATNLVLPFYERTYYFEQQTKDTINSRLNLLVAVFAFIISAITFFLSKLPPHSEELIVYLIYVLIGIVFICIGISLFYFSRCIFKYEYGYVSSLDRIDKEVSKMEDYNSFVSNSAHKIGIEDQFLTFFRNQYRRAASKNRRLNKRKSKFFLKTIRWLLTCVASLLITTVLFFIHKSELLFH